LSARAKREVPRRATHAPSNGVPRQRPVGGHTEPSGQIFSDAFFASACVTTDVE